MKIFINTDRGSYSGGGECLAQLLSDIMKAKEYMVDLKEFRLDFSTEGNLGGKGIPITQPDILRLIDILTDLFDEYR